MSLYAAEGWFAQTVAELTVKSSERGKSNPRRTTLIAIEKAFNEAGIVFMDDGDVAPRRSWPSLEDALMTHFIAMAIIIILIYTAGKMPFW